MGYYLFDNPIYFFAAGGVVELAALVYYFISQKSLRALALLAGPFFVVCGLVLDYAVQTDREQIAAVVDKIVESSVKPDLGAMIGTLHNDLNVGGKDINQIVVVLRKYFHNKIISSNHVKSMEMLSLEKETAAAEFTAVTVFDQDGEYAMAGLVTSKWRFDFARNEKGKFQIVNMQMLSMGNSTPMDVFNGVIK